MAVVARIEHVEKTRYAANHTAYHRSIQYQSRYHSTSRSRLASPALDVARWLRTELHFTDDHILVDMNIGDVGVLHTTGDCARLVSTQVGSARSWRRYQILQTWGGVFASAAFLAHRYPMAPAALVVPSLAPPMAERRRRCACQPPVGILGIHGRNSIQQLCQTAFYTHEQKKT